MIFVFSEKIWKSESQIISFVGRDEKDMKFFINLPNHVHENTIVALLNNSYISVEEKELKQNLLAVAENLNLYLIIFWPLS